MQVSSSWDASPFFCIWKKPFHNKTDFRWRSDCKTLLKCSSIFRWSNTHHLRCMPWHACFVEIHQLSRQKLLSDKRGTAPHKQSWRFLVYLLHLSRVHCTCLPPFGSIWCLAYWRLSSSIRWAMYEGCWWILVSRFSVCFYMCLRYYRLSPPKVLAC